MATTVARLEAVLSADSRDFDRGLSQADKSMSKAGKGIGKAAKVAGVAAAAGLGAAVIGAKKAVDAASNLEESQNAVRVVFGKSAKTVLDFGQNAATKTGLSMRSLNELVTPLGASFINLGDTTGEAAKKSLVLAQRAADMASVFNVDVKDALGAIQAGLRGEADPLERFGVGLSDAAVRAQAMEMGLAKTEKQLTASDKAQARYSLLLEQTNRVAGDFKNTSDSLANSKRILSAQVENVAAKFGSILLPALATLANTVGPMAISALDGFAAGATRVVDVIQNNWPRIQKVGEQVFGALRREWESSFRPVLQAIGDAMRRLAETAERNWPRVQNAAQQVSNWYRDNLRPTIVSALDDAREAHEKFTSSADSTLRQGFSQLMVVQRNFWQNFGSLFTAGLAAIRGDWQEAWDQLVSAVKRSRTQIGGAIDALLGLVAEKAKALGKAIVDGIVSGIKSGASSIGSAITGAIGDSFNAARRFLESQSPSEKAARELGRPIPEGMAKGILSGKTRVTEAMVEMAHAAVDRARSVLQNRIGELQTWLQRAFSAKQGAQMTPTELLINEKELAREVARLKEDIASAQTELMQAQASGDPVAVAAAQRRLDDAKYNQWLFDAQRQAAAERQDLENKQFLEQQAFEKRLQQLNAYLESGRATVAGANQRIRKLEKDFGLTGSAMGELLGRGFVRGLRSVEKSVAAAANALRLAAEAEGIILKGRKITIVIEEKEEAKKQKKGDPERSPGGGTETGSGIVGVGRWLQSLGYQVGEHPAFGGVGKHRSGSYHYLGRAIDINWPGGGGYEANKLRAVMGTLGSKPHVEMLLEDIGRANQHLHYAMAQGGIGTVRKPTTFLAGEAGPEDFAFVPHSKGGIGNQNITIHMPNYVGSKQEFLGWLKNAIRQDKRAGGLGFA